MFEQLMKRSDWVWTYKMGRFAAERRAFLCHLNEQGHSLRTLQNINKLLLAVAERVNVRKAGEITEAQISQAAKNWATKSCAPSSNGETREMARKRCLYWAKNWFRFLGKWNDPVRNAQFRSELDNFLNWLRSDRGYTEQTILHASQRSTFSSNGLADRRWL
jgi:hypothetical protein